MLAIGGAAGAASFTHVRDVAAAHGQPGWLAWADAVVLELMSIASGLELRRRKRAGVSVVFPAAVLACAVTLSLAAQVVEAEPSPIGWIAAAVPALGFLVMVKIALGYTDTTPTGPYLGQPVADRSTAAASTRSGPDHDDQNLPVADSHLFERTVHDSSGPRHEGEPDRRRAGGPVRRHRTPAQPGPSAPPVDGDELLAVARGAQDQLAAQGQPLTRATLASALRTAGHTVSNTRASQLLKTLKADPPPTDPPARHQPPADRVPTVTSNRSAATPPGSPLSSPSRSSSGDPPA
ncbi:DUF2637 domain-containing protein [Micromonospora yangpuensis]|nr:DUF2637 domain-containing protein [Micromonospora yangpuensis]GGL88454.1 hypothetical protein GCM10012279_02640 [Micromonospora yangpuensis]